MTTFLFMLCFVFIVFTLSQTALVIKLFDKNEKLIKENSLHLKELEKEYRSDVKEVAYQISAMLDSFSKVLRLVDKLKFTFMKKHNKLVNEVDNLFILNKEYNKIINSVIENHNDLANLTYDGLKEIFCDLNDCDCSECEFYSKCIKHSSPGLNDENDSSINKNIHVENNPEQWDSAVASLENKNSFKMNLSNPESFEDLKLKMQESGIPDRVIDNYIEQIKYLVKVGIAFPDQEIEVIWGTRNKQGYLATSVTGENFGLPLNSRNCSTNFNKFLNKLVNPNSKIVKTLERLYNLSDKDD